MGVDQARPSISLTSLEGERCMARLYRIESAHRLILIAYSILSNNALTHRAGIVFSGTRVSRSLIRTMPSSISLARSVTL